MIIEETDKYIFIFDKEREIDPYVVEDKEVDPKYSFVECFETKDEARMFIKKNKVNNMSLESDIKKETKKLIKKAKENGIYENFGQKEVRKLEDKYGDGGANFEALDKILKFEEWCMNYCG